MTKYEGHLESVGDGTTRVQGRIRSNAILWSILFLGLAVVVMSYVFHFIAVWNNIFGLYFVFIGGSLLFVILYEPYKRRKNLDYIRNLLADSSYTQSNW